MSTVNNKKSASGTSLLCFSLHFTKQKLNAAYAYSAIHVIYILTTIIFNNKCVNSTLMIVDKHIECEQQYLALSKIVKVRFNNKVS